MAARTLNRLTAAKVNSLKKPGWHADGGGLYLRIQAGGAKSWVIVDTKGGKRTERGVGSAAVVSLKEARDKRDNPTPAAPVGVPLFGDFATTVIEGLAEGWSGRTEEKWLNSITNHASAIEKMRLDAIGTEDVLAVLRPIWTTIPDTARRLRGRIEHVLAAAKVLGHRPIDAINPATWEGHLEMLLPKPTMLTHGHHAAMPYQDLPAFMARLRQREAITARALEFLILNANRSGEVRLAKGSEILGTEWLIPAPRMKMKVEHTVLLGMRSLEILEEMRPFGPDDYIFPGQKKGRPFSDMAMEMLVRDRMKVPDITIHGFRSAFKDWALNETDYPDELSEEALAHLVGSKVRRAYRRSVALRRRRALMEDWERFLIGA